MDALEGRVLATKVPTSVTFVTDENNRGISPSWYLARASSPSLGQSSLEMGTMKPMVMIPESQMILKNDLELIKAQLHAQTKAFQALSHSITLLEQESSQQEGRIKELEDVVQFAVRSPSGEMFDALLQRRIQDMWKTMTKDMDGLQGSMLKKENSVESLSQEILESKKFLWEELEAVQGELRRIHLKLKDQEVDITRNLVNIKKMQENQMKCTRFLAQLRGKIPEGTPETVDDKPLTEELNDIWSAVNTLRNSITSWSDKKGSSKLKRTRRTTCPALLFFLVMEQESRSWKETGLFFAAESIDRADEIKTNCLERNFFSSISNIKQRKLPHIPCCRAPLLIQLEMNSLLHIVTTRIILYPRKLCKGMI